MIPLPSPPRFPPFPFFSASLYSKSPVHCFFFFLFQTRFRFLPFLPLHCIHFHQKPGKPIRKYHLNSLPSMEYYNSGIDRPRQAVSMEHGENEWNRPYKTEGSISYHSPQYPSPSEPQFLGRSTLILPPPSSLMPTFNYRPTMMTTGHQYSGYNVFVDQSDVKSSKRKRNSSPPVNVSTSGCHYEVLNMAKRKRSKRDATAAETLASFSRLSTNTAPYYSAEGAGCGDKYKHNRGRNKGDSGCHDSQSLVFEAARILCGLSTRR
ncbi:hypothetical protein K450DRAFT_235105 [Umbelopsis ramanniana AG]|uniref:Uncharacterized protein n=1 Tax=Umbelopsis ramanniana AG TaxID=1314678 RepID=A0AAD5ECX3_UMBRA|nr:uncharacterized protein K450DRAFT_235105 [Umbelopsis ramanniana AG]KAI8580894.1 hypothetical protein K450DRAFT_235105 [Umbelopsis ramanniana AG]